MNMGRKEQIRIKDGKKEHIHNFYDWWHPVTRKHDTDYVLEFNIGCLGEMWTCINRNIKILKKEMQLYLHYVLESRTINEREYWVGEVLRLTTWGITPSFTVDDIQEDIPKEEDVEVYYPGPPLYIHEN